MAARSISAMLLLFVLAWSSVEAVAQSSVTEDVPVAETNSDPIGESTPVDCGDAVGDYGGLPGMEMDSFGLGSLGLRHSATHGRALGLGDPLRGTSWRNRPWSFTLATGGLFMAGDIAPGVDADNDLITLAHLGWDFDHYWGVEWRLGWSTPHFANTVDGAARTGNDLLMYDASVLYYPWGDSRWRPYGRLGVGITDIEYANSAGIAVDESMFTLPFAVGVKYQSQRWLAMRAELADNLAFGGQQTGTLNNFTLTFGLEWRFGGQLSPEWRRNAPVGW